MMQIMQNFLNWLPPISLMMGSLANGKNPVECSMSVVHHGVQGSHQSHNLLYSQHWSFYHAMHYQRSAVQEGWYLAIGFAERLVIRWARNLKYRTKQRPGQWPTTLPVSSISTMPNESRQKLVLVPAFSRTSLQSQLQQGRRGRRRYLDKMQASTLKPPMRQWKEQSKSAFYILMRKNLIVLLRICGWIRTVQSCKDSAYTYDWLRY